MCATFRHGWQSAQKLDLAGVAAACVHADDKARLLLLPWLQVCNQTPPIGDKPSLMTFRVTHPCAAFALRNACCTALMALFRVSHTLLPTLPNCGRPGSCCAQIVRSMRAARCLLG